MNYLMNGLAALAFIVLFSQCAGKTDNQTSTTPAQVNAELSGMKIAYVEIDSLLAKYNFCIFFGQCYFCAFGKFRIFILQTVIWHSHCQTSYAFCKLWNPV